MMLARHLQKLARRPVRYGLSAQADPELAAAIRNYLALTLRGANVPHLHHQAQGVLQPFYQTRPGQEAQQAFHGLLSEHDPAHLLAYLDLLGEHGEEHGMHPGLMDNPELGMPIHTFSPRAQMLWHLHNTARPLSGRHGADLLGPDSPVRAFTPGQLQTPGVRQILRVDSQRPGLVGMVVGHGGLLRGHIDQALRGLPPRLRPMADEAHAAGRHVYAGDASHLAPLYDALHALSQVDPRQEQPTAGGALRQVRNLIQAHVIPHLYANQPE